MRHRLHRRILASLLGFALLAIALSALASHLLLSDVVRMHMRSHLETVATAIGRHLPATGSSPDEVQAALESATARSPVAAAVWSADGRRLAFTSSDLPTPAQAGARSRFLGGEGGPAAAVPMADGRVIVVQSRRIPRPAGFLAAVFALAVFLALASLPVARRITSRLETLEAGVRRLGEGDLAARVEVSGDDEITSLGRSFNRTAERVQELVAAQRRVLASASHELRSPLARLRLALELAQDEPARAPERMAQAVAEVAELDALVEQLLLAGRLEVQAAPVPAEAVDVGALLAEEAQRTGAAVQPGRALAHVDPALVRVMVRNLLENALRHGGGSAVEAGVEPLEGVVRVWVADRGPGVPENERERIFDPFYRPPGPAERAEGVGLGLYLVRRVAESYGGEATCRARDGGGAFFEVTLRDRAPR